MEQDHCEDLGGTFSCPPALLTSAQLLCLPSALKATSPVSKPTVPFQLTTVA